MNNKIRRLIVSNQNEGKEISRTVYVNFNHFFENNKQHFYLSFMSDKWPEGYFLPLNHIKSNGQISNLNTFSLFHEELGFNLEEIWRNEGISLYGFLNESLYEEKRKEELKEDFAIRVSKFMYVFLGFPFEQTMKILNWIYNSNYTYSSARKFLLTTFGKLDRLNDLLIQLNNINRY